MKESAVKELMVKESEKGLVIRHYAFAKLCLTNKREKKQEAVERKKWNGRIYGYARDIVYDPNRDLEERIRVAFCFSLPATTEFKHMIESTGDVEYDLFHRIASFRSEALQLTVQREDTDAFMYRDPLQLFMEDILEHCETEDRVRTDTYFLDKFVRDRAAKIPKHSLLEGLNRIKKNILYEEQVPLETRIRSLFALNASVDEKMKRKIETLGTCLLDSKNTIMEFRANEGEFELKKEEGVRAWRAGRRKNHQTPPRRNRSRSSSDERPPVQEVVADEEEDDDAIPLPVAIDLPFHWSEEEDVEGEENEEN